MAKQQYLPTSSQVSDPAGIERSFRQTLKQQYELAERLSGAEAKLKVPTPAGTGAGGGPANSKLLGLPVKPIDVSSQPAGTVLTYSPTARIHQFATPAGLVAAPATATSPGVAGQIAFDATHIYVCVATSVWVRAILATF